MIEAAQVRGHLKSILASPAFSSEAGLRELLRYLVESQLKGQTGNLTGPAVARELFQGSEEEAGLAMDRLRRQLRSYYGGPGRDELVRIEIPARGYAPNFVDAAVARRKRRRQVVMALIACCGAGATSFLFTRKQVAANTIAVVPARWTFVDPSGLQEADEPLSRAVAEQLSANGRLPVLGWSAVTPYRDRPARSLQIARDTGAGLVLAIAVRPTGGQYQVTAFLAEPYTGRKRWAEDFYAQRLDGPAGVNEVASAVVRDLEIALGAVH